MGVYVTLPHRVKAGMCPVNGLRDLIHWRAGRDWSNEFVHGLGQGGGFAYLRINVADPPRQVYWGIATPRQHDYLAQLLGANHSAVEGRAFKSAWERARAAVDAGAPPILGPLDMYYLHYYPGIYNQRHIPIHYVLLAGYDAGTAYVYDTRLPDVQAIPLDALRAAWDVNAPGLGKRNRVATFDIPAQLPPTETLIRQAVADQARNMLKPPVSLVGLPAMRKLAREIAGWPAELGAERAGASLAQTRTYLNSPPDSAGQHLTAGRDRYIAFLEEAGPLAGLDFAPAIAPLHRGMALIPQVATAIAEGRLADAGEGFAHIAAAETDAYTILAALVGAL